MLHLPPNVTVKYVCYSQMHYSKKNPNKIEDQLSVKFTIQEEPTEQELKVLSIETDIENIPPL